MVVYNDDMILIDVSPEKVNRKNVKSRDLDDSGIVEDLEFVDVGDDDYEDANEEALCDVLDTSKGVIELDEESFNQLQLQLEDIIEEGNINADDLFCKIKPCFVSLYKMPVFFEEEKKTETKKNRGNVKNVTPENCNNNARSKYDEDLRRSTRSTRSTRSKCDEDLRRSTRSTRSKCEEDLRRSTRMSDNKSSSNLGKQVISHK